MEPQWTPRMQQVAEEICRYALETGEMPTLMEISRRIGLSRERTRQLWARIERREREKRLDPSVHIKRAQAGYLLAVLKDIERAARKAALGWPWRSKPRPPPKPRLLKPNLPPPRDPLVEYLRSERLRQEWETRYWQERGVEVAKLIECPACHGTAVQGNDWCPVCAGEGTVDWVKTK